MSVGFISAAGFIRDGKPIATIAGPRDGSETTLRFAAVRGRLELGSVDRRWPSDFSFDDVDHPDHGWTALEELLVFRPFTSVTAIGPKGALEKAPGWQLIKLYASHEKEFRANFFRAVNRIRDRQTQLFAVIQVAEHYRLDPAHRCVAAVIRGFRAMDLGVQDWCQDAAAGLKCELRESSSLPDTTMPRTDRSHLTVSMGSVLWQLYLYTGQYRAFLEQLDETVAFIRTLNKPFPGVILNGCLSVLLRAYIHQLQGEPAKATELAHFNANFYVTQMSRLAHKAVWFKEMMMPHKAAFLGLEMAERIRDGRKPLSAKTVIHASLRVTDPEAVTQLETNFAAYCRKLRKFRKRQLETPAADISIVRDE